MSAQVVKKRKVIGLTGNIASGKSEALSYISHLGYDVIDSDFIVKSMWKDETHLKALSLMFHLDLSKEDVKKTFIKDVFLSQSLRLELESYMHPRVYNIIHENILKSGDVVVVDVPLLYETEHENMFDAVILIMVDHNTQLNRLLKRGYDKEHALKRMQAQMSYDIKKLKTTYHVDGSLEKPLFHHSIKQRLREILNI